MKLYKHQLNACNFAVEKECNVALFMEVGLGKTLTTIEIFKYFRKGDDTLRLLVICPKSLINAAWGEDITKFSSFKWAPLRKMKGDEDILIVNYESLISKNILPEVIDMLLTTNWMGVCDESSRLKNPKAITTKTLLKISHLFKHRIILSGIPTPNSLMEIWSQMHFIRPGLLGRSFFQFRNTFFHLARGGEVAQGAVISRQMAQQMFQRGWKYDIEDKKKIALMDIVNPYCFWAKKKDCLDLPDEIDQIRHVEMSGEQKKHYKDMKEFLLVEIKGNTVVAQVALTKFMKLRQITGGFIMGENGITPMANAKIKELMSLLVDIGDEQVIIWGNFVYEIETITETIGRDKCAMLYGNTKDKDEEISAFKDGSKRYLVANPQSSAHGLTFVNCATQIFYSMNYSYDQYYQARGRIHRIGQTRACTYIHLICPGTIDDAVFNVIKRKGDLNNMVDEIVRGLK